MTDYYQLTDGEWIFPTMNKHRRGCCDCALVHEVDFRIVKKVRGGVQVLPSSRMGLMVMTRSRRNDELTDTRRQETGQCCCYPDATEA